MWDWLDQCGEFKEIMESLDRNQAGATAPAQGLYLYKVNY